MGSAPIRVHEDENIEWMIIREVHPRPERYPEEYLDSKYRIHEDGTEETLQLLEAVYQPNTFVDIHAHLHDEIIYIVEGAMLVGGKSLLPGSSIFVAAKTLYSFKAGTEGVRFLNFRPTCDNSHIFKDDFLAMKRNNEI